MSEDERCCFMVQLLMMIQFVFEREGRLTQQTEGYEREEREMSRKGAREKTM